MSKYDHQSIEKKWQARWAAEQPWAAREHKDKKKFFALVEFPYPSGEGLHVGHLRSYTAMDIIARKRRMDGFEVLYPIGWDAFGLPAENYALKTGQHPRVTTEKNCANFRRQLQAMGFSFDWSREVNTTDPAYYKWTQWIFLQLLKHGLAYKTTMPINWCPKDKIGLANEEATGGVCERCGGPVEKRDKEQWMLKITAYAEKLLAGLDTVDYIERAKVQQTNWIGRSEGAILPFRVIARPEPKQSRAHEDGIATSHAAPRNDITVEVFTTRPDTLFGATYLVLAPEHPLIEQLLSSSSSRAEPQRSREISQHGNGVPMVTNADEARAYVDATRRKSEIERTSHEKEKTGVELKGVRAVNPANGEAVPVWVADYVLGNYGTGAIMAVPAHDERDFAFAKQYGLSVTPVIASRSEAIPSELAAAYVGDGNLVNSGKFTGMSSAEAKHAITEAVGGKATVTYKLRDWVFSRQRYWGEPIPVVFCATCGTVPVPESQLPVLLPEVERYQPTDTGESPLAAITDWVNTKCPQCNGPAKRETDVMPNWAGSSWYFLRYCDPKNDTALASPEQLKYWMPIDWYNGGMEHTTLHLLYSRFWNLFLHDIGVVPVSEPYAKRTSHGMILASDGEKMSKSRGNVVNPDDIVAQFGADAVRVYEMFIGPFDQAVPWSTDGLVGCRRFLEKVAALAERVDPKIAIDVLPLPTKGEREGVGVSEIERLLHKTIKKVTEDIEAMHFNTAVSALMECTNVLVKRHRVSFWEYQTLLTLLTPFAPHLTEDLWERLRSTATDGSELSTLNSQLSTSVWPPYDPALIIDAEVDLVVQVNGKVRATLHVPADIAEAAAKAAALAEPNVLKHLEGKDSKKVIYVPGKLVSIVV